MTVQKAAFIHIPKTAGIYVHTCLSQLLAGDGYKVHRVFAVPEDPRFADVHKGFWWTEEELLRIAKDPQPRQLLRNHSPGWSEASFRAFKENGWFTFAFTRHPGDLLCSLYFFSRERYGLYEHQALDEFVMQRLNGKDKCWHLPPFWREMDYVQEFTEKAFADFMKKYFGHDHAPSARH